MNYRGSGVRLLFGTNQQTTLLATGIGILLGVAVWLQHPILGMEYWLGPSSLIDWTFVIGFILLAAGVAFYRGGLLAAWWVSFPAHVPLAHYYYFPQRSFVALPFQNDLLSYVFISATIALVYGLLGYLLGSVSRWGKDQSSFTNPETDDR